MSYDAGTIGTAGETGSRSAFAKASDSVRTTSQQIGDAIEKGREPGMPLDLLGKLTREAPVPCAKVEIATFCGCEETQGEVPRHGGPRL